MAKSTTFQCYFFLILFSVLFLVNSLPPQKILPDCVMFFLPECGCRQQVCRRKEAASSPSVESLCSEAASYLGEGQKVLSYTLFHRNPNDTSRGPSISIPYLKGLASRLKEMRELYPGWVLRLYSNLQSPLDRNSSICTLRCGSSSPSDFFYCNASSLPGGLGNLASRSHGTSWRFAALADPTVETFLSRDLDSSLSSREVAAVRVWEKSTKTFHIIRDHIRHTTPILAGMWGAKASGLGLSERQEILQQLLQNCPANGSYYGMDQAALAKVLYTPKYHNASLAHDQLYCGRYNATLCIPLPPPAGSDFIGRQELNVRYKVNRL